MSNENLQEDKLIENHEYDGIHELDNPLPGWWLATFYITIVFAVVYYIYYQLGSGPTLDEELQASLQTIKTQQAEVEQSQPQTSEETLLAMVNNQAALDAGKNEFVAKCVACHGAAGQGLIGPNLTDEYWIHGDGSISAILQVANEGVLDKGMPPWKGVISPDLLEKVSVYVYTLQGTNPDGAKAPQGEKVTK